MALTIPEHDKPAFRTLLSLSDEQIGALVEALKHSSPARYLQYLSRDLSSKTAIDSDSLYELIKVLAFFAWWREDEGMNLEDIVRDLSEGFKRDAEFGADGEAGAKLSSRIRQVLGASDVLRITSKASGVLSENERRLCADNCRIISEIRPIFPSHVSGMPDAAVTAHTMKIAYHEGDEDAVKEFFVSLDRDDLDVLWELIDRAIDKEVSLREFVKAAGVLYIKGQESDDANP